MDYFAFADAPFDAIVSDSTLHLIPAPNDKLFGKIAQDLKPGGLLICSVPYDCAYNRFLWTIRRFFRLIRSPLTDRFIYGMGRLLQGKKISSELLWDRVHYMYLLPHCIFSSNFNALLSGHYGLECVAEVSLPWASVAQPRHRLFVYRKVSPGSRRPMND
jgi:SAM-dependent methyltransferase